MSKVKNIGKEIGYFLTSKIFLKNIAAMVVTIVGLIALVFLWMRFYTHHGDSLQVPSYLNMNINEAVKKAKQQNLRVVVNDSIWLADKPAGTVLEQNPQPLSKVKEKRTIYLTITKFQAEEKLLPTLAGNDNYNYYARRLKQLKINLEVKEQQFSSKLEENTILFLYYDGEKITGEDLKKGISVPQGATVEAVVTTRGGGSVDIPDLLCKKYGDAEFIISASGLNSVVIEDGTVTNTDQSFVWKQMPMPSPGQTIDVGSEIRIYLTKRPTEDCN